MVTNKQYVKKFSLKNNLSAVLSALAFAATPVAASDNFWLGSEDSDVSNDNNWSEGLPDYNDDVIINTNNAANAPVVVFDEYTGLFENKSLSVGKGQDNTGHLVFKIDPSLTGQLAISSEKFTIGVDGGAGQLDIDMRNPAGGRLDLFIHNMSPFVIGDGAGSVGTVNILGSGKSIENQNMQKGYVVADNGAAIGINGGVATVNIDGGGIAFNGQRYEDNGTESLLVGSGANSVGTVNVLAGGKISSSLYNSSGEIGAIIGDAGGQGVINISGHSAQGDISRATFSAGMILGNNGGSGYINILDGGMFQTFEHSYGLSDTVSRLGVDGGIGSILVSGNDSKWWVMGKGGYDQMGSTEVGKLHVGVSGEGYLTINNGGLVAIGKGEIVDHYDPVNSSNYMDLTNFQGGLGDLYLADEAGSKGILTIGAAEGQAAQAVGTLEAKSVIFGAGQGSVVFNHTDQTGNYSFDTELVSSTAGQGTIKNINGVTLFNTDQTNFSGKTDIVGGTFVANSTLGGTVSVSSQGTLAGIGSVGSTTLHSGGNIAPGEYGSSAPATLTIDGDLTTQAGSTYTTNITTDTSLASPYVADVILVNGDAYLNGGTIKPVASGDFTLYTEGSRWKILEATGSVIGQFDGVQKLAFVNLTHDYDPQNVYLVVTRNSVGFCTEGMTDNQCSVGKDIEEQGDGDIYDLITSQQTIEDAKNAFDQLSGEIHASAKGALLEDSRFLREAINKRLQSSSNGVWVHTFGSWGKFKGNDNAADLKRDIGGFFLGADKQLGEQWQVGFMGGYSRAELDVDNRHSNADRDDAHIGVYTQGQWGNASVRLGAGHSWHDFSTTRNIEFPGLKDRVTANYDAQTTQVFAEGSYKFQVGKTTELEPFVSGAYVHLKTDGFTEKGGIAKLMSDSDKSDIFFSTIGTKATHQFELGKGQPAKVWAKAGWRHAFNQKDTIANLSFQSGGKGFEVKGTPIEKNTAALEFGMEASLSKNTNIGLMYNGQIGADTQDHGAKVYFNWVF
ncbi:autotransporter outer membrane beta-barrel domain-containing protein [Neisseria sp. Ec49-e6-T10]|uniref:autotransporter outer membrane beta-barrel domain-containing protein n=1 Tax=Neisseria sp. Ec49-e6-T10 TaxID=3140744 RepID=UPI003EBDD53B